jgi:hypothetical protein
MTRIHLEPVDSVTITTLVENVYDTLMPDQGPARRTGPLSGTTCSRCSRRGSCPVTAPAGERST